ASRFQMPFEGDVSAQTKWLDGIMQTEFNGILDSSNGKFTPMIGKGGQLVPLGHFNTVQEAYRALAPHFFDDNFIRSDLASQGYNLEKVEGGYRLTGPNLSKPLSGSLRELLPQVGYEFTKIPDRYAPSNVIVDPATVKMTYDGTTLRGPVRDLAKSLDMFFDPKRYAEMTPLGKFKDAGLYKLADGTIEVDIPRYNSKMTFPSEADARRFLAGDVSALSNVERMAQAKALDVRFQNGEWTVNDGRGRMTAKSRADVAAIMATYPDVKPTNELFASIDPNASTGIQQALSSIDPKMLGEWKSITPDFSPYKFYSDMQTPAQVIKEGIRNRLRAEFSDTRYFIDKTFSKYGLTDGQRIVRQIDAAMDAHSPSVYNEYKTLASVFTDSNGKPIPYERRVAIAEYRIAETTEDFKAAQDAFGPLSPDEQKAAERLDTMLGDKIGTNTTALAAKYGIGFQKFYGKGQYLSRVRAYYDANPQVVSKMALGSELNNAIGNVPASVRAWFDNERVSDILNFAAERDPQRILMRYIAAGNKQLYLDGAWRAMNNWMNANKERLPPFVVSKLNRFREQVNGTYQIPGEDFIKGMGRAIVQKVRGSKATPEDLQAGENLASNFYQLTYFTSLGFRPYQAVRNVAQIFTTLAPRIGNDFTMAGLKRALNMSAEEAQHLQGLNVIKPNAPGYENFLEGRTWVRKTMQAGMQWFKNGDDVGRAAAYFAADEALTPAISKLQRGLYGNDIQKFIDDSMLFTMQKLNPTLVNDVLSLVNKGTPEAISQAKATFGAQLAKETFPSFEWWNQPKFYSEHILTRLFGQYGTFATIYRSNLYRAFASGTAAQKAAFAARFIGNNLAIFGALSAMNIKANDFIPGVPALFGGGPNFKLGVDLMQALDSGQNGQEARYNLEREFSPLTYVAPGSRIPFAKTGLHVNYPEVLPGSLQAHFIQKGLKYLQAGDTWKAFLSFTTTPTNP
ncbi:hypothetical protein KGP36_06545, partial [Patescibacteria group bacterium]|nr:hypothetical protein [Patescibacteria group bacterium]